ncbi:hypothetical protein GH741_01675 [Aquibacillus halophilus]|uniref:Anti-sigma factor n=1 Tax=Aquibacillus halophilus TaxID=930132 RepID=A0A6A8D7Y6_9BACI|nr:anti-sigma factor [Aquibacillus halophilus]MRH41380.1 hypothetical protein [Aquibacillus halophilus]
MSDEFKSKLAAYEKGELSDSELEAFEKELDKLEEYQEYLEDTKTTERTFKSSNNDKRQKKILKRGKWKARIQTALTALAIFILFTIVSSVFTSIYYSWGTPDRVDVYRNIIDQTLTITNPYGVRGGTSTNGTPYFGLEATRDLSKTVGHDTIDVGEMKVKFLFSMMGIPEQQNYGTVSQETPTFTYPDMGSRGMSDWDQLEQLPEGTVVSAYLSFSELIETEDVFPLFEEKNLDLLWLAVDTGEEEIVEPEGMIFEPVGFPSHPIWHDDDMVLQSREVEKTGFLGKVISEGSSSPDYQVGDQGVLHQQFLKTLAFLEKHEKKANNLIFGELNLAQRIEYLETNGFNHYGVVITGPTKEVLKLKEEQWVGEIEVDEVAFWNWQY